VHAIALVILGEKGLGQRLLGASKEAFELPSMNGGHHLRFPEDEVRLCQLLADLHGQGGGDGGGGRVGRRHW
jgi:hypothetical protein